VHPQVDVLQPAETATRESFAAALARHPDRDVVLRFSNAPLESGFVDRLVACARRESSTATVSAFSDRGPFAYRAKLAPADADAFFAKENAGVHVEIPAAMPPVIYVTRAALSAVSPPASAAPGDVLDFCARATEAGLRHLLCAEAFAGGDGDEAAWRAAVEARPGLAAEWLEFEQRAPAIPPRRRVDVARLRASPRPRVLFVTHHWGGGVELHVRDLANLLADDCEVVALRPGVAGTTQVQWLREGETLEAWFETAVEWPECVAFLKSLGIARVHVHHVHGLPKEALDLPRALGVPFDVTLHDHFAICPQYHLADPSGRYCGEPDEAGCNACLAGRPAQWSLDIAAWRALFHRVLHDADRVIAPSNDLAARVHRHYPDVRVQVWPHPEMRDEAPLLHKVLLLGGLSAIKGMDLFEACVRDAMARALPFQFVVLGHVSRPLDVGKEAPVTVLGSYADAKVASLVELERPDAFLFLSQVPESYSYTLTVAMQAAKPIVATQLGAFVERLRGYPAASLVPPDAGARAFNDALLRAVRSPVNQPRPIPIAVAGPRA
jgi:glycosyltransferase involved in cell wall biosynthesis